MWERVQFQIKSWRVWGVFWLIALMWWMGVELTQGDSMICIR